MTVSSGRPSCSTTAGTSLVGATFQSACGVARMSSSRMPNAPAMSSTVRAAA
jgi:hypothetical protein